MPGRRLSRFLHLERRRTPGGEPDPTPGAAAAEPGSRFDALEQPAAGPAPRAATGARLERFEPAARAEPALELLETPDGSRPFTRCIACGMDHGRQATACANCGTSLETPAQLAFNERLWTERQAEAARERADGEAFRAQQEAARVEETRARRAFAEDARPRGGSWRSAGGWGSPPTAVRSAPPCSTSSPSRGGLARSSPRVGRWWFSWRAGSRRGPPAPSSSRSCSASCSSSRAAPGAADPSARRAAAPRRASLGPTPL